MVVTSPVHSPVHGPVQRPGFAVTRTCALSGSRSESLFTCDPLSALNDNIAVVRIDRRQKLE